MSETGELPCVYCGAEPPPVDEHGRRSCCEAGRDADQAGMTIDAMAAALNFYADPANFHGEIIMGALRHASPIALDGGRRAADVLTAEHRLNAWVEARRSIAPMPFGDIPF